MSAFDRLRVILRDVRSDALRRWNDRQKERAFTIESIRTTGEADTPERTRCFVRRRENLEVVRALSAHGALPPGLERRIGPTLDYVPGAPSETARKAGRPVARLVEYGGPGFEPVGLATGFLVGHDLLMTNHHVFPTAGDTVNVAAHFLYEYGERGLQSGHLFELDAGRFFANDEALDFAVVAVKPVGVAGDPLAGFGQITLNGATGKVLKGHPVYIIQHPDGKPKQYAFRNCRLLDILEGFLHYETDTLRGSSGSPAFSNAWELIALHHSSIPATDSDGNPLTRNGQRVGPDTPDEDIDWVANEGIRVSVMVQKLASMRLADSRHQDLLRALVASTSDPLEDARTFNPSPVPFDPAPRVAPMAHNSFVFHGPVTINVLPPAPSAPTPAILPAAIADAVAAPEKVIRFDPDKTYKNRKGYDPAFLNPGGSIVVPAPTVSPDRHDELDLGPSGEARVLKYHHYELVMNAQRRLQHWSAVNVDYDLVKKSKRDRKEFGTDKWIPDPRLPTASQLVDIEFYKPAGNIDRGHIVRREDNAWGDSEMEIEYANADTFHWTNCTPQHEAFNQSDPGRNDRTYRGRRGLWGDFENYVQQSRKGSDTKACVLAGPVLAADDPTHDFGEGPVAYPIRFWKVICVADPDQPGGKPKLKAFGFLFSQKEVVEKFGIEARFDPGRFSDYHVKLKDISVATGVIFAPALHKADTKT